MAHLTNKHPQRITATFLGIYAGLIAIQHGIFGILQGNTAPDALMFNAIGPPCQAEEVWHACFPAMTLLPNLLVSGIAAVLVGLSLAVWAAAFSGHKRSGPVLGILSVLVLVTGGGFVPVWIGMAAAVAASLRTPDRTGKGLWNILGTLWPWPLVLMALWLPGSWVLGYLFREVMLQFSGMLFLVFDVGMPVLAAMTAFAREKK
jgi:hypothetical protein